MRTSVRLLGVGVVAAGLMAVGSPAYAGGLDLDLEKYIAQSEANAGDGGHGGDGGENDNILSCTQIINILSDPDNDCSADGGDGAEGGDAAASAQNSGEGDAGSSARNNGEDSEESSEDQS